MIWPVILTGLLLSVPAGAQNGTLIPDDMIKTWVLKKAYQANGNSIVGECIDMTGPKPEPCVRALQLDQRPPERSSGGHH